ncbi:MAG: carbohydrate ABC transporter permease [Candidatus Pararuminococcus gallinarum]|jgi:putative aldouronate transport system permease protein
MRRNKNAIRTTTSRKIFVVLLTIFFVLLCAACLIPFIHVLALSFSHKVPSMEHAVTLLPLNYDEEMHLTSIGIDLSSYSFLLERDEFKTAFFISVARVALAMVISLSVITLAAYPLSKSKKVFTGRSIYAWFIMVTMFIGGGLVPLYITIQKMGMMNTIWALVIPGCASPFMIMLMLNFFRGIPKALEEAAELDGAGHLRIFLSVYLPLSLPSLATVTLFIIVGNWNAWFDGMIYMSSPRNYPLQTYLQTMIASSSMQMMSRARAELLRHISDRTVKAAQIFIAAVPMLILYPFLQRFFMSGITLGSVKE